MIDMDEVTRFALDEEDLLPRIRVHQNTFKYDTATGARLERGDQRSVNTDDRQRGICVQR